METGTEYMVFLFYFDYLKSVFFFFMSKYNYINDKKSKIMSSNPFAIIKFLEDRFPEKAIFLPELRSM